MKKNYLILAFALLMTCYGYAQQSRTVSGVVNDENNEGLPGVNVLIAGTSNGTITDIDGRYNIQVEDGNSLVFSFVGYLSQTIAVGARGTIDIQMEPDVVALSEVVVVGYGTQRKQDLSIAVSEVSSKDLTNTIQPDLGSALRGKASGVQVVSNGGEPGAGISIRVRGIASYNGSAPLYVVDGLIVGSGSPNYISTSDVENITVLKDAAATSVYGARGANGVVLITTKSGKAGQKGVLSYSGSVGIQEISRTVNLLNAREYALLNNEAALATPGRTPRAQLSDPNSLGEGTDWLDEIFDSAPITQHQLSFRGGSENTTYYLSGNYYDQEGIIGGEKADFQRFTFVSNISTEVSEKLRFKANLSFAHSEKNNLDVANPNNGILQQALNIDPVTPVRLPNGQFAASPFQQTDIRNPLNRIDLSNNIFVNDQFVGNFSGAYEIVEGLSVESSLGISLNFGQSRGLSPSFQLFTVDGASPPNELLLLNSVSQSINRNSNIQNENLIRYNRIIANAHNLEVVGGFSSQVNSGGGIGAGQNNLPTNDFERAFLSSGRDPSAPPAGGGFGRGTFNSIYGRVNYDFNKKYFFTASVRRDGSSNFGPDNRFGVFPAFSAAWVVSEESFLNVSGLSFLKLRAGWGINGSTEGLNGTRFLTSVGSGFNANFGLGNPSGGFVGSAATAPGNPEVKWEEIRQINIGLNIGLIQEKLSLEIDYYDKRTNDLLAGVPIPLIAGQLGTPIANVGSLTNKGVELGLNYNTKISDVDLSISGNVSYNDNEVLNITAEGGELFSNGGIPQFGNQPLSRTAPGEEVGSFFGFQTDGLFQTAEEVNAHSSADGTLLQPDARPGDIRFRDINGDGVLDADDRTVLGSPVAEFTFGLNTTANYKGFDLTLFLQGVAGNEVVQAYTRTDFPDVNRLNTRLNRWTGPGTTNDPRNVRAALDDLNGNNRFSDRFVQDASYLRVKTLQIGYTLPASLLDDFKLSNVRIAASVQNLLTITGYDGFDPEIGNRVQFQDSPLTQGIDFGVFPNARIYTLALSFDFQ